MEDLSPRPGDEDLVLLACRRTTFEWVLRRAALRTERVRLADGVAAEGFTTSGQGPVPRVTGIRTAAGVIEGDVIVDAGGRRSALPRFLAGCGVEVAEEEQDTGIIYLSRFYRLRDEATEPDRQPLIAGDLTYLKYGVFRGDNRTFSITLAIGTDDTVLRGVLDPARFEATCRLLPAIAPWVEPDRSEPITGVHVMGGLINRVRHLVVDGRPVAVGVVALGDASVCTNPLYGRGCSLGAVHAGLLADALGEHGGDLDALATAFDAATDRELGPWYRAAVAQDEVSKKALHGEDGAGAAMSLQSILREGLFPLARVDADVHRALIRTMNLLTTPDALLLDENISGRVMAHWQLRDSRPPEPPLGPGREELVAALADAPAGTPPDQGR